MLQRKSQLQAATIQAGVLSTLERSSLIQQRTLAQRRQDYAEVEAIEGKLKLDESLRQGSSGDGLSSLSPKKPETSSELLAKVNERNRKANMEAVRKAELAEAERKRRERKLAAKGGTGSGRNTPNPIDPSARLRTMPRLFNDTTRYAFH